MLVGVSGGGDSMALLHATATMASDLGIGQVIGGHVDHGLRNDSENDRKYIEALTDSIDIPLECVKVRVSGEGGIQAAARRTRYQALEDMRRRVGAARILTAHTLDDQAETLMLRLARGTAITGLGGIRRLEGVLARPLLGLTRCELAEYRLENGVTSIKDPSNEDERFLRSRVRHEILPVMEKRLGPGVRNALGRLASVAADEDRLLERLAASAEDAALDTDRGLDAGKLLMMDVAIRRRVLARHWRARASAFKGRNLMGATPPPLEGGHLDRILAMLERGGSRRASLSGGMQASLSCGRLLIGPDPWPVLEPRPIIGSGRYDLPEAGVSLLVAGESRTEGSVHDLGTVEPFDRARLPLSSKGDLLVRGWRPGDRLGESLIADMLYRAGVPEPLRPTIPVVLADERPIWVIGLGGCVEGPPAGQSLDITAYKTVQGKVQPERKVEPS